MYDFEIEQKRQVDLWQTYHRRNVLERDLFIRKVHSIRAEKMVPNIRNEVLTWKLEQLIVTTLDRRGRHYKSQVVALGTPDSVECEWSDVLKVCHHFGRTYNKFILSHNHPMQSTAITPSSEDLVASNNLIGILRSRGYMLMDSIIFTKDSCLSIRGMHPKWDWIER